MAAEHEVVTELNSSSKDEVWVVYCLCSMVRFKERVTVSGLNIFLRFVVAIVLGLG